MALPVLLARLVQQALEDTILHQRAIVQQRVVQPGVPPVMTRAAGPSTPRRASMPAGQGALAAQVAGHAGPGQPEANRRVLMSWEWGSYQLPVLMTRTIIESVELGQRCMMLGPRCQSCCSAIRHRPSFARPSVSVAN